MIGKWILFKRELAGAPPNNAGVYYGTSPDLRRKSDFLKLYFHRENNILWIFQIEAYHIVCFILTIVNGKCILFKGGLAVAPQTMQGFPTAHRWIYGENRTF